MAALAFVSPPEIKWMEALVADDPLRLEILLESGQAPSNAFGEDMMAQAINGMAPRSVEFLLARGASFVPGMWWNALVGTLLLKSLPMFHYLLELGVLPAREGQPSILLNTALGSGIGSEVLNTLVKRGFIPQQRSSVNLAFVYGDAEVLGRLLQLGCAVNAEDLDERMELFRGAADHADVIRVYTEWRSAQGA